MAMAATWARTAIAVVALCATPPAAGRADAMPVARELTRVAAPAALASGYGIAVAVVPNPPAELRRELSPSDAACPVEVRAIVIGEEPEGGFAVLGVEDDSALVTVGEGVRTARGWYAVTRISANQLVLRRGDETFVCALQGSASSAAPVRQSPAR
jgi:hypothetical protein